MASGRGGERGYEAARELEPELRFEPLSRGRALRDVLLIGRWKRSEMKQEEIVALHR
ncbi:MAG: hypothetical protein H0U90_04940 [Actinobacteria bacterium]|nr:hypothetical protein [Actinomycetota bacterium]